MSRHIRAFPKVLTTPATPKKRGRLSRRWRFWLAIIVIVIAAWGLFASTMFQVKAVEISGVDTSAVAVYTESLKGKNIFAVNRISIETGIKRAYPPVETVALVRGLPNTVRLVVTLRQPKIKWRVGSIVSVIDARGELFDQGDKADYRDLPEINDTSGLPVTLGQRIISPTFIEFVDAIRTDVPKILNTTIERYEVGETTLLLDVLVSQDRRLRLSIQRPIAEQLEATRLILDKHPEAKLIDVRVPGWGYYK